MYRVHSWRLDETWGAYKLQLPVHLILAYRVRTLLHRIEVELNSTWRITVQRGFASEYVQYNVMDKHQPTKVEPHETLEESFAADEVQSSITFDVD